MERPEGNEELASHLNVMCLRAPEQTPQLQNEPPGTFRPKSLPFQSQCFGQIFLLQESCVSLGAGGESPRKVLDRDLRVAGCQCAGKVAVQ